MGERGAGCGAVLVNLISCFGQGDYIFSFFNIQNRLSFVGTQVLNRTHLIVSWRNLGGL